MVCSNIPHLYYKSVPWIVVTNIHLIISYYVIVLKRNYFLHQWYVLTITSCSIDFKKLSVYKISFFLINLFIFVSHIKNKKNFIARRLVKKCIFIISLYTYRRSDLTSWYFNPRRMNVLRRKRSFIEHRGIFRDDMIFLHEHTCYIG